MNKNIDHLSSHQHISSFIGRVALLAALTGCGEASIGGREVNTDASLSDTTDAGPTCFLRSIRVNSGPGYTCDANTHCNSIINLATRDSSRPTLEVDAPYCENEGPNFGTETMPGSGSYLVPMEITCTPERAPRLHVSTTGRLGADSFNATEVFKHINILGTTIANTWPRNFVDDNVSCTFSALGHSVTETIRVNLEEVESRGTPPIVTVTGTQLSIAFSSSSAGKYTIGIQTPAGINVFPAVPQEMSDCQGPLAGPISEQRCSDSMECGPSRRYPGSISCHSAVEVNALYRGANSTTITMPVQPSTPPTTYRLTVIGINDGYNTGELVNTTISY